MTASYCRFETLPANNKVRPMPHEIMAGGVQGVLEGVSLVPSGKVRAKKVVYPVSQGRSVV
jgi:hypothetical protein